MILVTGATGTVGREVVRVLRDSGFAVRAAVRDPQAARALLGEGLEYVRFEFGRPPTYAAAFANVRAMFLMRPPSITNVRGLIAGVNAAGLEHSVGGWKSVDQPRECGLPSRSPGCGYGAVCTPRHAAGWGRCWISRTVRCCPRARRNFPFRPSRRYYARMP